MYEEFLKKCKTMFHENHYLILSAMHCLSQLYGKIKGYLINDLTEEQLERKIEICKKLIKTFEKLEPGLSKQRGKFYFNKSFLFNFSKLILHSNSIRNSKFGYKVNI